MGNVDQTCKLCGLPFNSPVTDGVCGHSHANQSPPPQIPPVGDPVPLPAPPPAGACTGARQCGGDCASCSNAGACGEDCGSERDDESPSYSVKSAKPQDICLLFPKGMSVVPVEKEGTEALVLDGQVMEPVVIEVDVDVVDDIAFFRVTAAVTKENGPEGNGWLRPTSLSPKGKLRSVTLLIEFEPDTFSTDGLTYAEDGE